MVCLVEGEKRSYVANRPAAFEKADMERRKQKADSMQFMTEPDEDHARFPNKGKEGDGAAEKTLVESDSDSDSDREDTEFKEGTGYNNAPIQKVSPSPHFFTSFSFLYHSSAN